MTEARTDCPHIQFGLIVTGKTEADHLPTLFRSLSAVGGCSFKVIKHTGQRNPITSPKRLKKLEIAGKVVPTKYEELCLFAKRYLQENACRFVLLLDDLEFDRREQEQSVFNDYRRGLDKILTPAYSYRAAVHFLVYMVEAYYFADAQAINAALSLGAPIKDEIGDVEEIKNPKARLKQLHSGFDERADGGKILEKLDLEKVLARPETCASLRTLLAWCIAALACYADYSNLTLPEYCLDEGCLNKVTAGQIDVLKAYLANNDK